MAQSEAVNKVMGPEKISVSRQKKMLSMKLPREDDGKVHPACGEVANTSAARYADAASGMPGTPAGPRFKQDSGR